MAVEPPSYLYFVFFKTTGVLSKIDARLAKLCPLTVPLHETEELQVLHAPFLPSGPRWSGQVVRIFLAGQLVGNTQGIITLIVQIWKTARTSHRASSGQWPKCNRMHASCARTAVVL